MKDAYQDSTMMVAKTLNPKPCIDTVLLYEAPEMQTTFGTVGPWPMFGV